MYRKIDNTRAAPALGRSAAASAPPCEPAPRRGSLKADGGAGAPASPAEWSEFGVAADSAGGTRMTGNLGGISLFAGLAPADLAALGQRCRWRKYADGQHVMAHNDETSDIYFVVSGVMRATFFTKAGKQVTFRDIKAGGFFGELAALDGEPRSAAVVAVADAEIASMTSETFREVLRQYRPVTDALFRHFSLQVRQLTERVIEFGALDVTSRIHAELLRMARENRKGPNAAEIAPVPTHAEIAARVSTHREAVTRELNYLERQGILERPTGRLIVKDVAALAKMVAKMLGD